jgi:hypothetical protein
MPEPLRNKYPATDVTRTLLENCVNLLSIIDPFVLCRLGKRPPRANLGGHLLARHGFPALVHDCPPQVAEYHPERFCAILAKVERVDNTAGVSDAMSL